MATEPLSGRDPRLTRLQIRVQQNPAFLYLIAPEMRRPVSRGTWNPRDFITQRQMDESEADVYRRRGQAGGRLGVGCG